VREAKTICWMKKRFYETEILESLEGTKMKNENLQNNKSLRLALAKDLCARIKMVIL
jgi:hypothetical protein